MVTFTSLAYSATLSVGTLLAYNSYVTKVPNGELVPDPCNPGQLWRGFGHKTKEGGGSLSKFGKDFKKNSNSWTKAFCELDSDGDGRSNGVELGDPNCTWTESDPNPTGFTVTNPSICDGSSTCKNKCSASTGGGIKTNSTEKDGETSAETSENEKDEAKENEKSEGGGTETENNEVESTGAETGGNEQAGQEATASTDASTVTATTNSNNNNNNSASRFTPVWSQSLLLAGLAVFFC